MVGFLDALGFLVIVSVFFALPPLLLLYGIVIFFSRGIEETIRPAATRLITFEEHEERIPTRRAG